MLKQTKKLLVTVDHNDIIVDIKGDKSTDIFDEYITQKYSKTFYQPKLFGLEEEADHEVVCLNNSMDEENIYYFILTKEQCGDGYKYSLINISNILLTAERIIQHKENEKTDIMNLVPAPFYTKDTKGNYLKMNNYTINDQYSNETIVGKNDLDLWPNRAKALSQNDTLVLQDGKQHTFEETITLDDGAVLYYIAQKKPLQDYKNRTIGILGVSIEITDIKKLQQQLKKKNQELQLKDQLKKEFIKNFSHDVKLPINGIVGSTQLLQILTKDNPKIKATAEKIDNGVMSLSKMFDHLYGVMVNDEFNSDIHNKDFSFQELLDLEIALTKSSIPPTKNINVSMTLDDKIPDKLCGDAFKTSQILRNILSNSVRYTKSGEIKLIVELLEDMPDKIKIKFTVSDTGTGITTTEKDKIYEYGRRFITSYESNIPGTGIGLNIAKGHVDALGGTIDYDSKIGEGTQFFVELTFGKV